MQNEKHLNIFTWFGWHFYEMPKFLLSVWKNYLLFGSDFFSVPLLFSTLLSPWRRYHWGYPKGFSFVEYGNTFVSNIFSRVIGAICRSVLIVFGFIAMVFILLGGLIGIVLWLLLPFIMVGLMFLFLYGI